MMKPQVWRKWMLLVVLSGSLCCVLYVLRQPSQLNVIVKDDQRKEKHEEAVKINTPSVEEVHVVNDKEDMKEAYPINYTAHDEINKVNDKEEEKEAYAIYYAAHDEIKMPSTIPLIATVCNFSKDSGDKMYLSVQLYLKSLMMFNQQIVNIIFIINTNQEEIQKIMATFPLKYRRRLNITIVHSWFPTQEFETGYNHTCGAQRLKLADMFPGLTAALYTDLDIVFLRPVSDMFEEFQNFHKEHLIGLSGKAANSGILLMNLTRLRNYKGGWSNMLLTLGENAVKKTEHDDQYVLTLIQQNYPKLFYGLSETWNVHRTSCTPTANFQSYVEGWSIVHLISETFEADEALRLIVDVLKHWKLDLDPRTFVGKLEAKAEELIRNPESNMGCLQSNYTRWVTYYPRKTLLNAVKNAPADAKG